MTTYQIIKNGNGVIDNGEYESKREAIEMSRILTEFSPSNEYEVEAVEQDDETTDDDNTSMSYDFISNGDDAQTQTNDEAQFNTVGSMWNLGNHSTVSGSNQNALSQSINSTIEALDDDIDGDMKAVLQDASELVQKTRVTKFECPVEACGLGHSHSDHKHDVRDAFDVLDSFTDQMDFCPYCHCGVNELSMLMSFFPYISEPVFEDQHKFESIYTIAPDVINEVYREYEGSVDMAVQKAGISYNEIRGAEKDLKLFFERREEIEKAAQAAPIAQETRQAIEDNRVALEEATSQ